jgi:HK97 family phage prohead protease
MSDPDYNIGHVMKAVEDDHGLLVTAQLDLENPKAMQTYRMLKGRRINQMSFAYDVLDGSGTRSRDAPRETSTSCAKLKLYEVSVVPSGRTRRPKSSP